jgi:hypothetical protein
MILPAVLAVAVVMLVPMSRCIVLGLWRGEQFYKGRPTCYWHRHLLKSWQEVESPTLASWSRQIQMMSPAPWWSQPAAAARSWRELLAWQAPADDENDYAGRLHITPPPWVQVFGRDPAAVPVLLELSKTSGPIVRSNVVLALGEIDPAPPEAVQALINALDDRNCFVRSHAMVALGRLGRGAKDAVPALSRKWEQGEYLAHDALEKIDPAAAERTHPVPWEDGRPRPRSLRQATAGKSK